jgi:hypothetical protein
MRLSPRPSLALPFVLVAVLGAAPADRPLVSVPLQPYGPFYLIDVMIDDHGPFKFVIDPGTTTTIVDRAVVRELGLAGDGEQDGAVQRVEIEALGLGSARFAGIRADVRSLVEIWGDGSPDGVLGFDLFGDRLVTVDLPLQRLIVHDGELPPPEGGDVLSYAIESRDGPLGERRVPTIEIEVAGRRLNVELSPLGFGTLTLPKDQMEQYPLASDPGVIGENRTDDGVFPIFGASLEGSMVVGSHHFDNPSVFFSEAFEHESLGSGALDPFVLTLDTAHRRIRIERPTDRANPLVMRAAALVPQSGEGADIRSVFNDNVDRVRLMALLSPT